jgi:putative ABC transport system permease protein
VKNLLFWIRWSWRDLRDRWLLVSAIALTIGIGTGAYAGLTSTSAWRHAANDASYEVVRMFDVRIRLDRGITVPAGRLDAAARTIPDREWIAQSQERLVISTQVDASTSSETIIVPGEVIGVDLASGQPLIAGMTARLGRVLNAGDAGEKVAGLDYHFGRDKNLPASGTITLAGGTELRYVGQILTPEYFLVTTPGGGLFAQSNFAALVAPLDTVQELSGHPGEVNDLLIRVTADADIVQVRDQLEDAIEQGLPGVTVDADLRSDDRAFKVLDENIGTDDRFYLVFALVILGGATLAAFNLTSRIVESQRREIGIGMALGLAPRWIAFRPILVGAQVALLGVFLGIGVGLIINVGMDGLLQRYFPLPVWNAPFQAGTFAQAAIIGFALPFVASLYPVWRAVSVPPIKAIRTGFMSARGSGLAPLASWLKLPGGSMTQMPFRNVLRTPRRTVLTALGVGAAIAVFVGTTGLTDTMLKTIEIGENETVKSAPRRLSVSTDGFTPARAIEDRLLATGVLERAEGELIVTGTGHHRQRELDLVVELINLRDGAWTPTVTEGRMPRTTGPRERPEILLAASGAAELGVKVGDVVRMTHPYRNGSEIVDRDTEVVIVALGPVPLKSSVYMNIEESHRFGLRGLANQLSVVPAADASVDDVQRELFDIEGIASAESVTATARIFRNIVDQYLGLLGIVQGTALALALLIAFNTATIALDERAREHATMFAFGTKLRTVLGMAMIESAMIGLVGTIIGLIGGRILVEFIARFILVSVVPDIGFTVVVSAATVLTASTLGIAIVGLAPLIGAQRLRRTNIPNALRVVE